MVRMISLVQSQSNRKGTWDWILTLLSDKCVKFGIMVFLHMEHGMWELPHIEKWLDA